MVIITWWDVFLSSELEREEKGRKNKREGLKIIYRNSGVEREGKKNHVFEWSLLRVLPFPLFFFPFLFSLELNKRFILFISVK